MWGTSHIYSLALTPPSICSIQVSASERAFAVHLHPGPIPAGAPCSEPADAPSAPQVWTQKVKAHSSRLGPAFEVACSVLRCLY